MNKKSRTLYNILMAGGLSVCLLSAPLASAEINSSISQRVLPVFPIQSLSTGSANDVWVVRSSNTIEYCRSESGEKSAGKDNKKSQHNAVIRCYQKEGSDRIRFASVQAVHNADTDIISAYAKTISGDLVYCRVTESRKKGKNLSVSCHL